MNRFLGLASLGLASLALGVALWGSGSGGTNVPSTSGESPRREEASGQVRALEQRVKVLEETAQLLSRRVMEVEQRQGASGGGASAAAPVAPVAPAALADEVAKLRDEVRGMVAGEALNSQGGREYLKDMVRSVQEEARAEQRQQWQQQMQQVRAQAQAERDQRVRNFITEAKLDYRQEQALTRALQEEDTKRQALMNDLSSGAKSPRDLRQEMRSLRTETDAEMQKVLSADQQQKYTEMRREEWQDMRPRGGPGGGFGGPGGRNQMGADNRQP